MDRSIDWPWSWEEEIQWKADLEERDDDFLLELISNAVEGGAVDSRYGFESLAERLSEDPVAEEYGVTA